MRKNDSILFVVPPHCEPSMPLLAAAQLSAYAAKINLPFYFIDLNISLRNSLLKKNGKKFFNNCDKINSFSKYWNTVKEVNGCWNNIKKSANYKITWDGVDRSEKWYKKETLSQFVSSNRDISECEKIYLSHLWEKIDVVNPNVVAISISFDSQFLESITIGRILKKKYPTLKVIFGGGLIRSYAKNQNHVSKLFSGIVDIIFSGEGEYLLSALKEYGIKRILQKRKYNSDSANFPLFLSAKKLRLDLKVNYSQLIDYNIFDQFDYSSPNTIFPYRINSACYWGNCSFCADHQYNNINQNRNSLSEKFAFLSDLKKEKNIFGIMFQDSAISPRVLSDISDYFLKYNVQYFWGTNVRFEKAFIDRNLMEKMYHAGCRFLRFGLESGSQRIIDDMNKGFQIETAREVMNNCRSIGILTHIYLICGYPGENIEDLKKTEDFILNEETHPDTFNISQFIAYKESIKGEKHFKKIEKSFWDVPFVPSISDHLDHYINQLYKKHSFRYQPSRVLISPAHTLAFYSDSSRWSVT